MPSFTITQEEKEENTATFIFEPLEQGYGHTLGNALRRAMLDSLTGAAITQVKIKGIRHQFSTLKGMSEDVVEFILNLKRIRVRYDGDEPQTLRLEAQGPGEIKASQIKAPPMVSIINKDQILGTLANKKVGLEAELQVERGTGYSSAEERKSNQIGVIPIDATFTPVLQVSYHVEATRVGGRTDLDRLILKVITDGTLKPTEALHQTAKLLEAYFRQVYEPKVKAEKPGYYEQAQGLMHADHVRVAQRMRGDSVDSPWVDHQGFFGEKLLPSCLSPEQVDERVNTILDRRNNPQWWHGIAEKAEAALRWLPKFSVHLR